MSIAEKLFEAQARVGSIIHIPSMIEAECENPCSAVEEFVLQDLDPRLVEKLEPVIPGLTEVFDACEKDQIDNPDDGLFLETICHFLGFGAQRRRNRVDFLVRVEAQVMHCIERDGRFACGSYTGGWGHYRSDWYAGKSINDCVRQGLRKARADLKATWKAAPRRLPRAQEEE